jgi:hypothetical protein
MPLCGHLECCYAAADKVRLCNLRVGLDWVVVMATAVRTKILGGGSCDKVHDG